MVITMKEFIEDSNEGELNSEDIEDDSEFLDEEENPY